MRSLAPFLRWLLTDLFVAIRRNRAAERLIIAIDETRTLGRCRELVTAASELPGRRSVVVDVLAGPFPDNFRCSASTMLLRCCGRPNSLRVSDPAMVDPDERDYLVASAERFHDPRGDPRQGPDVARLAHKQLAGATRRPADDRGGTWAVAVKRADSISQEQPLCQTAAAAAQERGTMISGWQG